MNDYPAAEVRASDADRDAVLSELSEHFQVGRLTAAEFDERAGQALAARTWGELRDLLRDLPSALSGPQSVAAASDAASSAASSPGRSGPPALLPVAVLAGIGIAVALSVGVGHHVWGFGWLVLSVFIVRRVMWCAGASRRSGPLA
jgi:hypothetical protein